MLVFGNAVPVETKSPDLRQTLKREIIVIRRPMQRLIAPIGYSLRGPLAVIVYNSLILTYRGKLLTCNGCCTSPGAFFDTSPPRKI